MVSFINASDYTFLLLFTGPATAGGNTSSTSISMVVIVLATTSALIAITAIVLIVICVACGIIYYRKRSKTLNMRLAQ